MTLLNASILGGLLLAGLPVLLHLIMRAKPKRIEFPALRLLQSRQTSNSRRMRLRHILLLVLRAIVIAIAVLALTRPTLPAARYGLRWYEWLTLIGVVIACAMVYRWRSTTAAKQQPAEHLLRERRGRLRAFTVLAGLVAACVFVGVPWGLRVQGEITGPRSSISPDVPVAAVFVFDNSQSMTYKHESLTRLDQAKQLALDHLTVLPPESSVAITTLSPDSEVVFQADLAGARSRIEDLKTHAVTRSLNVTIRDSINAQVSDRERVQAERASADAFAREIYVLTDLSEAAWNEPDESGIRDLLVQHDWLHVYLIDVSVSNPINRSLGQLRLDRDATVTGQPVQVSVSVSATPAASAEAIVELFTLDREGNEIRGGGAGGNALNTVRFDGGSPPTATFSVRGLEGAKFQQGFIRLTTPDPMPVDDVRYFVFGVQSVPKVLLVGDREIDTWLFRNALQPVEFEALGELRFDCTSVTGAEFRREQLRAYDVVCVLNWTRPPPGVWSDLYRFVNEGGSLFVAAGGERLLDAGHWSTVDAQLVLPGVPLTALPFRPESSQLNLVAESNPIVQSFLNDPSAMTELAWARFSKSWTVDIAKDARVLMSYNDRTARPALLERNVGRGRVLMFTSAVDNNQDGWNTGLVTDDSWAFLMLVDEMMQYLTGAADAVRNFTVGEPVEIQVPESERFSQYGLTRPRFRFTPGTLPFDQSSVLLTDINEAGHYQLRATDDGNSFTTDFAANNIDAESNLTRMSIESLNNILGEGRYARVNNPEELDRAVNIGRLGIEVFPVLMGLLIVLFAAEHLMANFFYDEVDTQPQAMAGATE
ncbi:vWA domain-containing protein [Fuerstiella marisgermanici]|uniref:Uncharacterized protein n=1 Tax=Fuerstiella marisgermanici TaxID=1891926 RepID=A0A1P8WE57_9PLAN|nr:BatA and WFA domain-containing protein [Fuerstiella marisgermanici]APZ92309.1 hypothetical protein Fuma_01919 [Fuerstiella marisgermanici]